MILKQIKRLIKGNLSLKAPLCPLTTKEQERPKNNHNKHSRERRKISPKIKKLNHKRNNRRHSKFRMDKKGQSDN